MSVTPRPRRRFGPRSAPARMAVALTILVTTTIAAIGASGTPVEALLAKETFDPTPRVRGAVTVIGDSVLLGSVINSPTIGDQLSSQGWGPVRVRGGGAYSTGAFAVTLEARSSYWIERWRGEGWDAPNVLVNLGANDSGFCNTNLTCARNAIMHMVNAVGPDHKIWWPQVTRHPAYQHQADNWNLALRQIADERADFYTWDWPAVMVAGGFSSGDNTHLSPSGYRTRSALMAHEFTADLAFATHTGTDAALPIAAGSLSEFTAIPPERVIDTRVDPPGRVPARSKIVVDVSDYVPDGTTAIAAYVTATNTSGPGFLTAYECSSKRPEASAANHGAGETRGAVAITPISATGKFCLYTLAEADLVVDIQAAFVPSGGGLRFDPLDVPERLADTRETGRQQIIEVAVPDGAEAVALNIGAVFSAQAGFLTAYPCSKKVPLVATVNYGPNELISGAAFLPVGPDGTVCVYVLNPTDVTIDLTGTFSADGELVFQPATPTRMLDTRNGIGGWSPTHGQFQTIDMRVAPAGAKAVSGTLTMVTPMRTGFTRAWGCGTEPPTASITAVQGAILANSVTTGISDTGRLCVMARVASSTLFDVSGWWVPAG